MTSPFPRRYSLLLWIAAAFVAVSTLVRIGLAAFDGPAKLGLTCFDVPRLLATGALYDLAALAYVVVPFAWLALVWPNSMRGRRGHAVSAVALALAALAGLLFTSVAEFVFWNEFAARFNFIAVDYLIYTREVIGNIRESYPVAWILAAVAAAALTMVVALRKLLWQSAAADGGRFVQRLAATLAVTMLPVLSFLAVGDGPREGLPSVAGRELAGNGPYEFMRAFRSNDLDYLRFYRTLPDEQAWDTVRASLQQPGLATMSTPLANPLERDIRAAGVPKALNVVMVSIESLGSDYVESFGGRKGLTPQLDRLAHEGLAFTNLYATGLRTVRGLEALTLSIPPTPGHAVPMRQDNKGFQTLGGVFKQAGYEALYLYGGYSRFDNMRDFFGGNGYTVIDRSAIDSQDISHETVWGVADEDLFKLALREIDQRWSAGTHVFAHVMTSSNHRPFTYPAGRIDIPSGTGRDGAVKYTDWAIGEFVRAASVKPWFAHTLFVFVADHTSNGRGRTNLPPENYRIPMLLYAPGIVPVGRIASVASQIDVAPTVLAMLGMGYRSQFFGQDILSDGQRRPRAFMANYLTVGYMKDGLVVELSPRRGAKVVESVSGLALRDDDPRVAGLADEAAAHYQVAAQLLRRSLPGDGAGGHGVAIAQADRLRPFMPTPVQLAP